MNPDPELVKVTRWAALVEQVATLRRQAHKRLWSSTRSARDLLRQAKELDRERKDLEDDLLG